jgi:hypothetical protein
MIVPFQAGDALLADIASADPSPELLHLWWLGQSGFLLAHAGRHLLLDPYLSDSLTRKYHGTAKPHVRMTGLVIEPERLEFVEAVTSSHHHTDHLDPDTLAPLLRAAPDAPLLAPAAHRDMALERARISADRLVELDDGTRVELAGFTVEAVPAAHEEIERDDAGHMKFLGFVVDAGPFRVYASARSTSRCCRSTAATRRAAWPATSTPSRRRRWRRSCRRGSPCRATTRCSSSTPPRRSRSWRRASGWGFSRRCCGPASGSTCGWRRASRGARRSARPGRQVETWPGGIEGVRERSAVPRGRRSASCPRFA